jgi:hypothetical protein
MKACESGQQNVAAEENLYVSNSRYSVVITALSEEPSLIKWVYKCPQICQTYCCISLCSRLFYFRRPIYLFTVDRAAEYQG